MNQYVTGAQIKRLREKCGMTQSELAEKVFVSDKAVSKWETGRGFPDISLLENLSKVLGVSVIELLSGNEIINENRTAKIDRSKFYVCPICGNSVFSLGEIVLSCCGLVLPPAEAEICDEAHKIDVLTSEDEYYVSVRHEMTKKHSISFIAGIYDSGIRMCKLYPEQEPSARFKISGLKKIYVYCNQHGMFEKNLKDFFS